MHIPTASPAHCLNFTFFRHHVSLTNNTRPIPHPEQSHKNPYLYWPMSTAVRKISPSVSLIDETADTKQGPQHSLHLLAGPGSFSLALINDATNKFVGLESYNLQNVFSTESLVQTLEQIIDAHRFLKVNYSSVFFAFDNYKSTLIPEALFDPGNTESYLRFNHILNAGDLILTDQLRNIESRNVFVFPSLLKDMLLKYYPKIQIRHHSSALIESLAMRYKNESKPKLVLHISLTHFEIILFEGKHLRFYNTFRHQTSEDFIYYLLFVCEQLKLNPETLELVLIGEIEKNSAIYAILYKYIRNIRFGERPEAFAYCQPLNTLPKHFYTNLFSQQLFR